MAESKKAEELAFKLTFKERNQYVTDLKEELVSRIGKAQAIMLLQKVPKGEIRRRKLNPNNPKSPEFKYVEHAFVTETLNLACGLNWDLIITERERIADQAIVHGYLEVRFKEITIKKHASGAMRYIETNRNMTWADAFNGATSRMLRAAAARLGIGLEFYRHEEEQLSAISDQSPQPAKKEGVVMTDDSDPANASQIATLKGLGFNADEMNLTKGEARAKISELSKR